MFAFWGFDVAEEYFVGVSSITAFSGVLSKKLVRVLSSEGKFCNNENTARSITGPKTRSKRLFVATILLVYGNKRQIEIYLCGVGMVGTVCSEPGVKVFSLFLRGSSLIMVVTFSTVGSNESTLSQISQIQRYFHGLHATQQERKHQRKASSSSSSSSIISTDKIVVPWCTLQNLPIHHLSDEE